MSTAPSAPRAGAGTLEWRFRLLASSLVLVALAFVQKPGQLVADTKLDLVADPAGFLQRSLHMWDDEGAFGQLQNQGYGYLFPMGPFFWAGDLLGMPGWAVQRAWLALVLVVAFLGLVKLAEALGIGSPLTRIVAGFAFALSPRLLTTLGPISIEAWPSALAPWVLLPIVYGSSRGSPVRAAALSAVAVAAIGGVNAAAAAAVLPLPALWLLMQKAGPRRRRLMLWWPLFTLLGTLWWLVPLFLLGQYSPPFLDFIESARVTTFPTTLFDSLRGTSHWVPYLEGDWAAGRSLLTEPYLILDVTVVVALGLLGLAMKDLPHRGFLVAGLFVGLVLVTAGHLGEVQGWWAAEVQGWLDAALAPLRNVHKFDVIVRLPLTLGLAHLLVVVPVLGTKPARDERTSGLLRLGVTIVAVVAVIGSATPTFTGSFTRSGDFAAIPGYWYAASDWLAEQDRPTYALLVPGSSFGSYVWGHPADEPIQPLADSRWAVRNAIPLAPPGNIRMLDAIEARLNSGKGSPGLAPFLARAGVEFLVVRNDLTRSDDVPEPARVYQTLTDSPGITSVAQFGPLIGGEARLDDGNGRRVVVNHGWQSVHPAVEIFRVHGAEPAVASTRVPVVAGGPEDLLRLADLGVLGDEPTLLAVDAEGPPGDRPVILTDGLRLRETAFGRVHDNDSPTLTAQEAAEGERRPAREYELGDDDRWATVARLEGVEDVRASSSLSDPTGRRALPQHQPFSAVDGDPRTSWVSGFDSGDDGPWIELRFADPVAPSRVGLRLGDGAGREPRRVTVTTDEGEVTSRLLEVNSWGTVSLPSGPTESIRFALSPKTRPYGARLDVAEIEIPGVDVSRPLALPRLPDGWGNPDTVVLSAADGDARGCAKVDGDVRCAPGRAREGEDGARLDRIIDLNEAGAFSGRLVAAPRPGPDLDQLLQRDGLFEITASSATTLDPAGGPLAAVDGSASTTWIADPEDLDPRLNLQWLGRKRLDEIRLGLNDSAAAVRAQSVELIAASGRRTVRLDEDGHGEFEPLRTDQLVVRILTWERGSNLDYDETSSVLPVGVSEIEVPGLDLLPLRLGTEVQEWGCGTGPVVTVNGEVSTSSLMASPRQLFDAETVGARLCNRARWTLPEGENRVVVEGSPETRPVALILGSPDATPSDGVVTPLDVHPEGQVRATLTGAPPEDSPTIAVRQNQNDGWRASLTGESLKPLTIDGWQQGWETPEALDGPVRLEYVPGVVYRTGLLVGAVTLGALLVLTLLVHAGRDLPPLSPRHRNGLVGSLLAVAAMGLLAGTWAALATAAALLVARATPLGHRLAVVPWLVPLPLVGAAVAYILYPWTDPEGWAGATALPQLLVVATLVLLLVSVLGESDGAAGRRMKGRSTVR